MNEEELKKGCGKEFYTHDRIILVKCGTECKHDKRKSNQIHLCTTCQARLEGFQKGKLEAINKIDTFMKQKTYCKESGDIIRILPFEWEELKEQLQKEINSQTEQNSDKEVAQPYSKSDKTTKEIGGMK